jgi:hypothetical protein
MYRRESGLSHAMLRRHRGQQFCSGRVPIRRAWTAAALTPLHPTIVQRFMMTQCPLSCGVCNHICNDTDVSCGAWAKVRRARAALRRCALNRLCTMKVVRVSPARIMQP